MLSKSLSVSLLRSLLIVITLLIIIKVGSELQHYHPKEILQIRLETNSSLFNYEGICQEFRNSLPALFHTWSEWDLILQKWCWKLASAVVLNVLYQRTNPELQWNHKCNNSGIFSDASQCCPNPSKVNQMFPHAWN